jgi:hypothetical protein
MKNKIEVGQTVYLDGKEPVPAKVTKVGKKYFQIDATGYSRIQFFIDTLLSNTHFGSPDRIYLDKQELLDANEAAKLRSSITSAYHSFDRLSLDQLNKKYNQRKTYIAHPPMAGGIGPSFGMAFIFLKETKSTTHE